MDSESDPATELSGRHSGNELHATATQQRVRYLGAGCHQSRSLLARRIWFCEVQVSRTREIVPWNTRDDTAAVAGDHDPAIHHREGTGLGEHLPGSDPADGGLGLWRVFHAPVH